MGLIMVLFPSKTDIEFLTRINREVHKLFFNIYKLYIRNLKEQPYDPLYGETDESTFYWEPLWIPAFVEYTVERQRPLIMFGKDEERRLVVWCSKRIMEELEVELKTGDIFIIDNKEFEILEERLEVNLWNENIHLDRAYLTEMRRQASTKDNRIDREDVPGHDEHAYKDDIVKGFEGFDPDSSYEFTDAPFDPNYPEGPYDP